MKQISAALAALFLVGSLGASEVCMECHGGNPPEGQHAAVKVDPAAIESSVHAKLYCEDCHDINPNKYHADIAQVVYCGKCHDSELQSYNDSPHMKGRKVSVESLPTCITCHGGHEILSHENKNSITHPSNLIEICLSCHLSEEVTEQFTEIPDSKMIGDYKLSVHGHALLVQGNEESASCIDCHGSHSFMPSDDPESPLFKTHIAATCGECHPTESAVYEKSIHGEMLAEGVLESPSCTNCHGEHDIKEHLDPDSKVFAGNIPTTCNECHDSEAIVGKFGLKPDRANTFKDSFHGIANEFGETRAANCASCHGIHDIYPQSDTLSLIHPANIESTCGKCHEDLPEDFAQGTFHASARDEGSGSWYVRKFYIWFIPIILLLFVIYRVLEYKRRVKRVN